MCCISEAEGLEVQLPLEAIGGCLVQSMEGYI